MAHYAFLDSNSLVTEIIVGKNEDEMIEGLTPAQWYENYRGQKCVQTSYNTRGGVHYGSDGQPDGGAQLGFNYAGIGYTWDGTGFHAPQPFPSWTLNPDSYLWEAPTPMPTDGKLYTWDEATKSWIEVVAPSA
jgi:hypothetical protein